MMSAGVMATLIWHPNSMISRFVSHEFYRLMIMGLAMGLTAIGLIYSPWGKQSGAHLNPAVTATMLRLNKIAPWDATFYMTFQFIGGSFGLLMISPLMKSIFSSPPIWHVPTVPGRFGVGVALLVEIVMSGCLIFTVLLVSETNKLARFTGVFAGIYLFIYIVTASHISGMSINPARTVASAIVSNRWTAIWIYFVGPIFGMLVAAEIFSIFNKKRQVQCTGMNPHSTFCRVFKCGCDYWESKEPT